MKDQESQLCPLCHIPNYLTYYSDWHIDCLVKFKNEVYSSLGFEEDYNPELVFELLRVVSSKS